MNRVVAIVNQKGGVGKSTTAINLAAYLASGGQRTLVIDMDPQGNATSGLGVSEGVNGCIYDVLLEGTSIQDVMATTEVEGLDIVPSTINLAGAEVELASALAREFKLKKALAGASQGSIQSDTPGLSAVPGSANAERSNCRRRSTHTYTVRILRAGRSDPANEKRQDDKGGIEPQPGDRRGASHDVRSENQPRASGRGRGEVVFRGPRIPHDNTQERASQ